jgi:hypothetical protein
MSSSTTTTTTEQSQQQSSLSQNLRGFASGTASGIAKLVVGHPVRIEHKQMHFTQ